MYERRNKRSVSNTILRTVQQNEEHNIQIPVSERGLCPKQFAPNVQYSPVQPNTHICNSQLMIDSLENRQI